MSLELVGPDENIAHLKVGRFTETNYEEWVRKWEEKVDEILDTGAEKMILDLRGNPGGFFDSAIYAGDEFLDEGFVISKQRDARGNIKDYDSTKRGSLKDIEVVVLVNAGSASASEILAGALQQAQRASIIGEKTFGKGTAQRIYDLDDGSTLHLTTLRWLLPDGSLIERDNSVVPDVEVELTNDDFIQGKDPQFDKAIELLSK
jgi:carboxyl-terminal processing protease